MPRLSLSDVLAFVSVASACVLIVLDKANKLKGPILIILLGVAGVLMLPAALSIPWVRDVSPGILKFSRGVFVSLCVLLVFSLLAVWVSGPAVDSPAEQPMPIIAPPAFQVLELTSFPHHIELDRNVFRISRKTKRLFPIVVGFENPPSTDGFNETDTAWARIIFREKGFGDDMELVRSNVGCWVDAPFPETTFPFNKPRFLILGAWRVDGKKPLKDTFHVFEFSRELHRPIERTESMALPRDLFVDVILTASKEPTSTAVYRFVIRLGRGGMYQRDLIQIPRSNSSSSLPSLTFEILDRESAVRISGGREVRRIEAKVKLRCIKTPTEVMAIKSFHASLHEPDGNALIDREAVQVIYDTSEMKRIPDQDGWTITYPLTGYRLYTFYLEITPRIEALLSRDHFIRITMDAVGQSPVWQDFYAADWRERSRI